MSAPAQRASKRKSLDEKVLAKARKFVKLSQPEERNEEEGVGPAENESGPQITLDLAPRIKLRKPRTGKQGKQQKEGGGGGQVSPPESKAGKSPGGVPDKAVSKSKSKKKKKSRKKSAVVPQQQAKPENEEKHCREAISFLLKWNSSRSDWKFEKLKQVWLLKNATKSSAINDEQFEILLSYVASIKGRARFEFLKEMEQVVKKYDDEAGDTEPTDQVKETYTRARQLVQMLHDDQD